VRAAVLLKSSFMQKHSAKQQTTAMPLVNLNAAGIDIGDSFHAVAVPEDRDEVRVRTFGAMTCDLLAIAEWLHKCKVDTVAMESTGVYWKPLFGVLIVKNDPKNW
jgi:transposase